MVSWANYHAYGALKLENQSINEGLCIGQGFFVEGGTPQKWNICRIYFWWINQCENMWNHALSKSTITYKNM